MLSYKKLVTETLFTEKLSSDPRSIAHKMGLVGVGGAYYAPASSVGPNGRLKPDASPTHKNDGRKIVPLSAEEKEKASSELKTNHGEPSQKLSTDRPMSVRSKIQAKAPVSNYNILQFQQDVSKFRGLSLKKFDFDPRLKSVQQELEPQVKQFYARLDDISRLASKPGVLAKKELRKKLEAFITDWKLRSSSKKMYSDHFPATGGLYKMFGLDHNKTTQFLLQMIDQNGLALAQDNESGSSGRNHLEGLSKPNLGKKHYAAKGDPIVQQIFSDPAFSGLSPVYQSVFGPMDPNGHVLRSGGKNAKAFFEHSVKSNESIKNTITAAIQLAEANRENPNDTKGYSGIARALNDYRKDMANILKNFDNVDPKERSRQVEAAYATLTIRMHVADKKIASALMKNLAENALYDKEVAGGSEVYLPAEGSFPTGDKIVVTRQGSKIEKIESVSVKWGLNGKTYGMPAPAGNTCVYHPNKFFHDAIDNRAGRTGYETGVNSEIIHDSDRFNRMMRDSGLNSCFSKSSAERIRTLGVEMTMLTQKYIKAFAAQGNKLQQNSLPPAKMRNLAVSPQMNKLLKQLHGELKNGNQKMLLQLLGQNNYRQIMNEDTEIRNVNAMSFYSLMTFGAALKSSNGFPTILHNHQLISKEGKLVSETEEGSPELASWQMGWRPYDTSAKGLTMGYNPKANAVKTKETV